MDRRQFLGSTAVLLAAPRLARWERRRTRLILLGTAGGPRPHKTRAAPAQAIVVNDTVYVVDCGNGVARQLVFADLPLSSVRHIFITHHHSDHNADYGNLILLAWAAGLRTRLDAWGPPPLERMTDLFFAMNATDISARTGDEGRMPLRPLVHAHDVRGGGPVMHDDNVRVTAAVVHHPPMVPAFAYRFDAEDRSIVISGDTTPSESLVALARNADILVHEALFDAASVDRLVAHVPNASDLRRSILSHHTTAEEAGRIAAEAQVGTLVLSHLIPSEDPAVTEAMWSDAARKHFGGRILVGRDLMEM
ncbi:MAG TPA: MBL fold metallo-hydrolase [Gemmatimonadaceae bacterium]|nr:MBL fold metallo-hydrolase [Gemmatimonadaceae bacterium]